MSISRLMYKEDMVCVYIYTYTHTHTHTHNGILLSHKNEIMLFAATWIELELACYVKSEKDKYHLISLMHGV